MPRKALVQLFSLTGEPKFAVMNWIMAEIVNIPRQGEWTLMFHTLSHSAMLPHVRNTAVACFLNTDASDLIMIDDDNYGEPGAIGKLLAHDVDVVGAPCRRKDAEEKWPLQWFSDGRPIKREANGLIEMQGTGTGILRISRNCLDTIIGSIPYRWYYDKAVVPTERAWPVFEYTIFDNAWYGEDIEFCRKWRALGGKVYVDPDITTHHIGETTYSGSVGDWLTRRPKEMSITRPPISVQNELAK